MNGYIMPPYAIFRAVDHFQQLRFVCTATKIPLGDLIGRSDDQLIMDLPCCLQVHILRFLDPCSPLISTFSNISTFRLAGFGMSPPFVLHNTLGALFVGMVLATSLHGVSILQALFYYTHQSDEWSLKLLVAAVMIFDTVHQALITHTVYTYAITNWGNPEQLGNLERGLVVGVLFNALTALLVKSYLTMRLWRLCNRNILITLFTALFVLAEFGTSIAFTILALQIETFVQLGSLKILSLSVNALTAVGDLLIAGALCTLLHLSRTGFQRSDTMINKLILFAINTGLLTSLFAVASFVSYIAAPKTFICIAFYFCIGRLYTNALLASLNARNIISESLDVHTNTNDKVTLSLRDLSKRGTVSRHRSAGNLSIKINTTKEFGTDFMDDQGEDDHDKGNLKIAYLQTSNSSSAGGFEEMNHNV